MKKSEPTPHAEVLTGHLRTRPAVEREETPIEHDEEVLFWLKYLGDTHLNFCDPNFEPTDEDAEKYLRHEDILVRIAEVRTLSADLGFEGKDFAIIGRTFGFTGEKSTFNQIANNQGTSERRIKERLGELSLLLADTDWARQRRDLIGSAERDPRFNFELN